MVNQERVVEEFCELVKIDCSSRNERQIADLLKKKLAALGMEVSEDDVAEKIDGTSGNVFAFLKGNVKTAPAIMLSGHMDCVEPCSGIQPQIKDGIITSKGNTVLGGDDKAGVAGILEALRVIKEDGIAHGDIQIIFTVAEEGGLSGSKFIDKSLIKAELGYVFDSGGAPGKIIYMAPGQNNLTFRIRGKSAHAGIAPEEGINAIVIAGKALAKLKQGRIDHETTANVGIIKGGHATNIVPDNVEVVCEARSRDPKKLAEQTRHMVEVFEQTAAAEGAQVEVQVKQVYDPFVLEASAPVIALARRAAERLGFEVSLEGSGGGSDANYFNIFGVPSAVLGVGMSKVHTTDEYLKIEDLVKTAALTVSIIKEAASA